MHTWFEVKIRYEKVAEKGVINLGSSAKGFSP